MKTPKKRKGNFRGERNKIEKRGGDRGTFEWVDLEGICKIAMTQEESHSSSRETAKGERTFKKGLNGGRGVEAYKKEIGARTRHGRHACATRN